MLQIKDIRKQYVTGELVQTALDGVSLNLRDNEFVAILGPSGSGKTTLLNVIGGLDRYDSGDLIINNVSTKKYKDRDWDTYRNHRIGFVFQNFNLLSKLTAWENVEVPLIYRGVSAKESKKIAYEYFVLENKNVTFSFPVLILVGDKDTTGKVISYCKEWAKQTGYPLHFIKQAKHFSNGDNPQQVNREIEEFIQKTIHKERTEK